MRRKKEGRKKKKKDEYIKDLKRKTNWKLFSKSK